MGRQLSRFALVGGIAFSVHFSIVLALVPFGLHPLIANIVAFLCAFSVSYIGHRHWTFESQLASGELTGRRTLPKFFIVASGSFLLNELLYALLLTYWRLDYRIALFIVLTIVATLTFMFSKFWAFTNE